MRGTKRRRGKTAILLREKEEGTMLEILVAGAIALATLRRFGGAYGYPDEPGVLPEFRPERGQRCTVLRSRYSAIGDSRNGTLAASLRDDGRYAIQEIAAATQRSSNPQARSHTVESRAESLQGTAQGCAPHVLECVQSAEEAVSDELAAEGTAQVVSRRALVHGEGKEGRIRAADAARRSAKIRHHVLRATTLSPQSRNQRPGHDEYEKQDIRRYAERSPQGTVRGRDGDSEPGPAAAARAHAGDSDGEHRLGDGGRRDADAHTGLGSGAALPSVSQRLDASFQKRDGDGPGHLRPEREEAARLRAAGEEAEKSAGPESAATDEGAKGERTNAKADNAQPRRDAPSGPKKRLQAKTH